MLDYTSTVKLQNIKRDNITHKRYPLHTANVQNIQPVGLNYHTIQRMHIDRLVD